MSSGRDSVGSARLSPTEVEGSENDGNIPSTFNHVKVAVKLMGLTDEEKSLKMRSVVEIQDDNLVAYHPESRDGLLYNFDRLFSTGSTHQQIHDTLGKELVQAVMQGYNSAIVTYGAARTGKTKTLFGSAEQHGLITMMLKLGLQQIYESPDEVSCAVKLSFWEMNESKIIDMFNPFHLEPHLRATLDGGLVIENLTEESIESWDDVQNLLERGAAVSQALSNERGIRYHTFIRLRLIFEDRDHPEEFTDSQILFVNLKGSDRIGQLGAKGQHMREGAALNRSITALGNAIHSVVNYTHNYFKQAASSATAQVSTAPETSISKELFDTTLQQVHEAIPSFFGDNTLTRYLSGPLGGKWATWVLAHVSVASNHYLETMDTLENTLMASRILADPRRCAIITDAGRLAEAIKKKRAQLPGHLDLLAEGHPLTELQEQIVKLEHQYKMFVEHGEIVSEGPSRTGDVSPLYLPSTAQKWKRDSTLAFRHGSRSTIYVKTRKGVETFKGQWEADSKSGFGTQITSKIKYEGQWLNGLRHGQGVQWEKRASMTSLKKQWVRVYKGEWANGLKDGVGSYFFDNGEIYHGNWENGVRSGRGTQFFTNGDKYDGEWKNDKMHGRGVLHKANKDRFEGMYFEGLKDGAGTYFYVTKKQKYEGEWFKDVAKTGTISAMNDGESTVEYPYGKISYPQVGLVNPDQLIKEQIGQIQVERTKSRQESGQTSVGVQR